jgi:molecular chaperone HtpG
MSLNLTRILKASGQNVSDTKPVLEINPDHPIIKRLKSEADQARFADWSLLLFDQAMLSQGGELDDPATFVKRVNQLTLTLASDESLKTLPT